MPRTAGVSWRSTTCCILRKPSPRIVCRMSSVQPMKLTTHLIRTVPALFFPAFWAPAFFWPATDFFHGLRTCFRHLRGVFQPKERRKGGLDDVVRVGGADGFREHVGNP